MHPAPAGANPLLYTTLVFLHILLSLMAVGINATYGFWIARGAKDPTLLPFALKGVKFLDDYVANPCYIATGVTGLIMILLGKDIKPFLWVAIGLYLVVMLVAYAVYTPMLHRQIHTLEQFGPDSTEYQTLASRSTVVGAGMGVAALVIIVLKIYEPRLW